MGVLGLAFEQKPTQCYATQSVFIVFWVEYQPHILLHVMVFGAKVVDSLGLVKAIAEPGTQRPQTRMANLSWIDSFSTMCAQFRKLCTLHAYAIRMNSECTRKSGPIETGWISWSRTFPSNFDYIKCIHLNCSWILLSSWAQQNWWGVFFLLRFAAATVMCIVCAPPWNRLKLPSAYTHGAPQCHNRHIRHCQPVEFVERDNEKNASSITFYFVFRCFFFAFLFSVCSSLFGKMGLFVGLFICSSRPVRSATLSRHLLYFVLHIGIIYTQIDIISPESYAKNIQVRFCTLSWHDALLPLTAMDARHQAWAMADGKRAARNCLNDLIRAILVWRCCAMLAACGCCAASNKSE